MCKKSRDKRPNGRGGLFKRGKTFYAVWMRDGKRIQVSTHKTTRTEAEAVLADLTADYARGDEARILETVKRNLDRARRERMPIEKTLASFLGDAERDSLAVATIRTHKGRFARFVEWMARERPLVKYADELTLADARAFMGSVAAGQTAKTFNDYRALFMQIWDMLLRWNVVEVNPWKEIRRKERTPHSKKELDAGQLARLFASADGEMKTLFTVGIYTGLRLKDAALLDWRSVDLSRRFITLKPAKTERRGIEVKIPIVAPLFDALTSGGVIPSKGYVMPEIASLYEKYSALLSARIQAVFKAAGIETDAADDGITRRACEFGFHSFRHTFVSMAFAYGIPLPIVQAIVGHTNTAMTRHYLHIAPEELSRAMEKFKAIPAAIPAGLIADGAEAAQPAESATLAAFKAAALALPPEELAAARKFLRGLA